MEYFSTFDACKKLGIKRVTLKSWLDDGFIKPTLKTSEGRGPGKRSLFSREQLYHIRLFQMLIANGVKRKTAESLIKTFYDGNEPAPENKENWITIFQSSKYNNPIEQGSSPVFAKTSTKPMDVTDFKLIIEPGEFKDVEFDINDMDMVIMINFKKVRDSVDRAIEG